MSSDPVSANRILVYVAGPYTNPDPCENTYKAVEVGDKLLAMGFAPFIPHLSHFWHTMSPKPYSVWMDYDLEFLKVCDFVYRMPGASSGADKEVALAKELGIPVVFDFELLINGNPFRETKKRSEAMAKWHSLNSASILF